MDWMWGREKADRSVVSLRRGHTPHTEVADGTHNKAYP